MAPGAWLPSLSPLLTGRRTYTPARFGHSDEFRPNSSCERTRVLVVSLAPDVVEGVPRDEPPMRLARGIWSAVEQDTVPGAVARSALDAARTVFAADYCGFVWQSVEGEPPAVAGSQ